MALGNGTKVAVGFRVGVNEGGGSVGRGTVGMKVAVGMTGWGVMVGEAVGSAAT